jgi:lycopene beta-cyclase
MHDFLLLGGGLANGLIAWRLAALRPDLDILLVDKGPALGGNHTWSFYGADVTPAQLEWLMPLVAHAWEGYEVHFPAHRRRLSTACYSISSERFHASLMRILGHRVRLNATVTDVSANGAVVDGKHVAARCVIDGRGHERSPHMRFAWQKFLGQELEFELPHGQSLPVIMDATVEQLDGYRFVYTLPLSSTRMLVEDTYYSESSILDPNALRLRIAQYAKSRGWASFHVTREESGVLPVTLDGNGEAFWHEDTRRLPCSGLRAGLFHATTGYSLPSAVRLADAVAAWRPADSKRLRDHIQGFSSRQWREQAFLRLLNRMMFHAGQPAQRYRVLQRFYTLPQGLIERFYAGRLTWLDRLRILAGKPPVPVLPALRAAVMTEMKAPPSGTPTRTGTET